MIGLVMSAVLLSLLRLGMYNLHRYSDLVESSLATELPGLSFDGVRGTMNQINPVLTVETAEFSLPGSDLDISLQGVAIELSLWRSILEFAPVVRRVSGGVEGLQLVRSETNQWALSGYPLKLEQGSGGQLSFQRALVLLPEYIDIRFTNLTLLDIPADTRHQIESVSAFMHRDEDAFEVQVAASLPRSLGYGVLFKSRITEASSVLYAHMSGLQLSPLSAWLPLQDDWISEGELTGVSWLVFEGNQLAEVSGRVKLDDTTLLVEGNPPAEVSYRGNFAIVKQDSSWSVSNEVENLSLNQQPLRAFNTELGFQPVADQLRMTAWFDQMELQNLVALVPWIPEESQLDQVVDANPSGFLQDIVLRVDSEHAADILMAADFPAFSSQRSGDIPGFTNLSGSVLLDHGIASIELQGRNATVDFGDFFTEPMSLRDYQLAATVQPLENGLSISATEIAVANDDATVEGRVLVSFDGNDKPFLYVRAKVLEAKANRVTPYLPAREIDPEIMAWLKQAVQAGDISDGEMLFHGRLNGVDKWASERSGEMQIEAEVRQVRLDYDPQWPVLEQADASLVFHNMAVSAELSEFGFNGKVVPEAASFSIKNYEAARVDLKLRSTLPAQQLVNTWLKLPPSASQRDSFARFDSFTGQVKGDMSIQIPLDSNLGDEQIDVKLDLDNVSILSEQLGIELSGLNGNLAIDESSMLAEKLEGRFYGDDVTISLTPDKTEQAMQLQVNGRITSANLMNMLPDEMRSRVSGRSNWQLAVVLPNDGGATTRPELQIIARSDLRGTAINLPAPLTVKAVTPQQFVTNIQLFERHLQYSVGIGDLTNIRGLMRRQGDDFQTEAVDIALRQGFRSSPPKGLRVYGNLPEFSTDEWMTVFSAHSDGDSDFLELIDVTIESADLFGYQVDEVDFWLRREGGQLNGSIEAPRVSGVFQVPEENGPATPLVIELERLILTEADPDQDSGGLKPTDVPNIDFRARNLAVKDLELSNVDFSLRRSPAGLTIDRANATQGNVRITSAATWSYDAQRDQHDSLLSVSFNGSELGSTMEAFGFGRVITGGTIEFNGDFNWQGPLTDIDMPSFMGEANLTVRDGVLNDVDPGVGRLIGLLSISALPRRLALDFNDVVVEGMEFEKISGDFNVANEELITTNTRLRGPTADIKISGVTGITRRDYDQVMLVTPKLSASLPLLGTITAGSGIGWGLLLLRDLYKDAIDESVEVKYVVKGSWDDPQLTEVKKSSSTN